MSSGEITLSAILLLLLAGFIAHLLSKSRDKQNRLDSQRNKVFTELHESFNDLITNLKHPEHTANVLICEFFPRHKFKCNEVLDYLKGKTKDEFYNLFKNLEEIHDICKNEDVLMKFASTKGDVEEFRRNDLLRILGLMKQCIKLK